MKAFDSVDNNLLCIKLEKYGGRGKPLDLLCSDLSDKISWLKSTQIWVQQHQKRIIPSGSTGFGLGTVSLSYIVPLPT